MKRTVGFKAEDQIFIKEHRPKMSIRAIALVLGCSMGKVRHFLIKEGMSLETPRKYYLPKPKPKKKPKKRVTKKPRPKTIVKKEEVYKPKSKYYNLRQFVLKKNFRNVSEAIKTIGRKELLEEFELHSREG